MELVCPNCGSKDIKHFVGDIYVCRDCGEEIYAPYYKDGVLDFMRPIDPTPRIVKNNHRIDEYVGGMHAGKGL